MYTYIRSSIYKVLCDTLNIHDVFKLSDDIVIGGEVAAQTLDVTQNWCLQLYHQEEISDDKTSYLQMLKGK